MSHLIFMLLSFPALVVGWLFVAMGIYYLGASLFYYSTNEENTSLAAIWAFLFSFGIISISGLLASKAEYASNKNIQQIYKYSIIISAVLFLGYLILGTLAGVINSVTGG